MRRWIVYWIAGTFLAVAAASACAADRPAVDAKALFEGKCGTCHGIDRPKSKNKSAAEWEKTVMRMKNDRGCAITTDEAKILIDYLAKNYGEKK